VKKAYLISCLLITFSVQAQNLTSSLIACYALNANASEPINNLTGTLSAVTGTLDRFNNSNSALAFSGSSLSYVELPNNTLLKPTNALSISAWIKTNSLSEQIIAFTRNPGTTNFGAYTLMMSQSGGALVFRGYKETGNPGGTSFVSSTTTVAVNTWYHVVFTVDNSLSIYVNGSLQASTTTTVNFTYNTTKNVYLGGTNETFNLPFNGTIDNVRFYNKILTSTEVSMLYSTDPACATPATALSFDGFNDFVDPNVLISSFNNSFTYECWARPTSTFVPDAENTSGIPGLYNKKYLLWPTWRGNEGGIGISVGTNGVGVYAHGNNYMPALLTWTGTLSGWTHIAVVVNNKQPTLYINGVFAKTGLTASTNVWPSLGAAAALTTLGPQTGGLGGGASGSYANYYQGEMDEFRCWSTVRTQTQIATFMNTELNCSPGLVAYYKFNHGIASAINSTVTSATDYSGNNYTASLNNFSLSGSTSNWIQPGGTITSTLQGISISASGTNICSGQSAVLTATGSTTYTWSTGSNSNSIIVTPSLTTTYVVSGCSGSVAVTVTVNNTPTVAISGNSFPICPGYNLALTASGAQNYTWQPGNLTGSTVNVTPSVTTVYTITGANGPCTAATTITVQVYPPINLTVSATPSIICSGESTTLSASGAVGYTWQPGNSPFSGIVLISPTASAVYTVSGVSGQGCTASATVGYTVIPTPTITVAGSSTVCAGSSLTLTASGASSYTWYPGPVISSTLIVTPATASTYTVLGTGPFNCSNTATKFVVPIPPPVINSSAFQPNICSGSSATLMATGGNSYTWQPGSQTGQTISVTPTITTVYTVTGSNGNCTAPSTVQVIVSPTLTLYALAQPTNICIGNSATLAAAGGTTYTWYPGNINGANIIVTPSSTTIYTVSSSNGTCTSYMTVTVVVSPSPTTNVSITQSTICPGYTVNMVASGSSGYNWQPGNFTGSFLSVTPSVSVVYTVTGTNSIGCISTKTVPIAVNNCTVPPISCNLFYSESMFGGTGTIVASNMGIPNSSTVLPSVLLPPNAFGLAVGPSFGFNAPNPTHWTTSGGTYWYHNGSTFVNTGHLAYGWNLAGSKNYLYGIGTTGIIYKYTGAGNATTLTTVSGSFFDLAADDQDNFYVVTPGSMLICNSSGSAICTFTHSGIPAIGGNFAGGVAIAGNTVAVSNGAPGNLNIGIIQGSSINFSTTSYNGGTYDFGNCPLSTSFSSSISASPNASVSCSSPVVTLSASAIQAIGSSFSYTWSGPGIISGVNGATVQVNAPGVYNCLMRSCPGGTSVATFTVINNLINPVIGLTASSPTICAGSTVTLTASNGLTYTWQPPGPSPITGPTLAVSPSTSSAYTVTGMNSFGCVSSATILITVVPNYTVNVTGTSSICAGSMATLTATGANSYSWSSGAITQSIIISPPSTTIYTVTGNINNCLKTNTFMVTVIPNPTVTVTPVSSTVCSGSPATLIATGASSYFWQPGGTSATLVVSPVTTSVYSVTGFNSTGLCASTKVATVSVHSYPTLSIVVTNSAICIGNSATLTANGLSNYTWSPGGQTGSVIVVSPTVSTNYTVSGITAQGCPMSNSSPVIVQPVPGGFSATANPTTICPGGSSTLTASGILSFTWMPGNINSGVIVVTPSVSTVYTVLANSGSCVVSKTVEVKLNPAFNLSVSASPTLICAGSTVSLTGFGALNYTWQPGNQTGSFVTVTPSVSTQYTLTGNNGSGCSATIFTSITVLPSPQLTLTASPATVCPGYASTLTATGAQNYTWYPGGAQAPNNVVTPNSTTNYTVTGLSGTCQDTKIITLTVNPNPTITAIGTPTSVCAGIITTLIAGGGNSYTWQPGNLAGALVTVAPFASTQYTVSGSDIQGCISSTLVNINVLASPVLTITASSETLCLNQQATLTAIGATGYTWLPNSISAALLITPTVTTTYSVAGVNSLGCIAVQTIIIKVENCLTNFLGITLAAGKPVLVNSNYYRINFTVTAANSASLDLNELILNNDLAGTFPSPITYTISSPPTIKSVNSKLQADNLFDGGAYKSLTRATSTLSGSKRDTIEFSLLVDPHGTYRIFNNSVTGTAKLFNGHVVTDSSNNGFVIDPDKDGNPTNNNEVTMLDLLPISFFAPEGFSPNNDGLFDRFEIKGLEGRKVHLTVYNRWGNKVYEHADYDNSWDGSSNVKGLSLGNGKLTQSTYYYILQFTDGNGETKTGFVEIQY
jgi:gliding motility-associated-like protein